MLTTRTAVLAWIHTAHGGAGTPYIYIREADATPAMRGSLRWQRRRDVAPDPGTVYLRADARVVGHLRPGCGTRWSNQYGPLGWEAEFGGWAQVEVNAAD